LDISSGPAFSAVAVDDAVAEAVANALHWDLALPRDRVAARCDDGWVTLTGQVERAYQRSAAEADVMRVVGVRGVTNTIVIAPPSLEIGPNTASRQD
jgi:osmotically-inducible protein OsmY